MDSQKDKINQQVLATQDGTILEFEYGNGYIGHLGYEGNGVYLIEHDVDYPTSTYSILKEFTNVEDVVEYLQKIEVHNITNGKEKIMINENEMDNLRGLSGSEFFKLIDTVKKSQDFHDEIHINFKSHQIEDMRTDMKILSCGDDQFKVTYHNKDLVLDLPDLLKDISKYDIKSIYTYSEVQTRNELHSEIRFNSFLNEGDITKLKSQLNELENRSESRAVELKTANANVVEKNINVKEKIIQQYSSECPYIKHINEKTAETINELNKSHGKKLSINELKYMYKEVGTYLENSFVKETFVKFKELDSIVSDLKHAQLDSMKETSKEKSLTQQNKSLSKNMEHNL